MCETIKPTVPEAVADAIADYFVTKYKGGNATFQPGEKERVIDKLCKAVEDDIDAGGICEYIEIIPGMINLRVKNGNFVYRRGSYQQGGEFAATHEEFSKILCSPSQPGD